MKTIQARVELQMSPGMLSKAITEHQALPRPVFMLREVKVVEAKKGGVGAIRQ